MAQNPAHMPVDEIIREIRSLSEGIEQSALRITNLSLTLYSRARRRQIARPGETEPEDTTPFVVFANGWARMAGSLRQGVQRMARTDRVLERTPEKEDQPKPPVIPESPSPTVRMSEASMEELVSLYGGEIVNDAFSR